MDDPLQEIRDNAVQDAMAAYDNAPTPPPASVPSGEGKPSPEAWAATRQFSGTVVGLSNSSEKKLAAIIERHFSTLRRERDELVEQMKTRIHTGENSEDCPFCLTKTQTPGVPNPMCHLCDLESERDALRAQVEQDRAFREWCYVTVGTDNFDCLKTLLENGMKDRATIAELEKEVVLLRAANSDVRRIADEREAFRQSLADIIRIVEAMRYTAGLGKGQLERFEKAKALLARYSDALPVVALANAKAGNQEDVK